MTFLDDLRDKEEKMLIKVDTPFNITGTTAIYTKTSLTTTGLWAILNYLRQHQMPHTYLRDFLREVGIEKVRTKPVTPSKHSIVGRFPIRVAKYLYEEYSISLPIEVKTQVGNLFALYQTDLTSAFMEVTREFDWEAGDFGDAGSCFWSDNKSVFELFRDIAMFHAVKFYAVPSKNAAELAKKQEEGKEVILSGLARCWAANNFPYTGMVTLFNAYGIAMHEIISLICTLYPDLLQCRISLTNNSSSGGLLYINSGSGYVLAPKEILEKYKMHEHSYFDFEIPISEYADDVVICYDCDREVGADEAYWISGADYYVCQGCYEGGYGTCERCGESFDENDFISVNCRRYNEHWCENCRDSHADMCEHCNEYFNDRLDKVRAITLSNADTIWLCDNCADDLEVCSACNRPIDDAYELKYKHDGSIYCDSCAEDLLTRCSLCDNLFDKKELIGNICESCLEDEFNDDELLDSSE